MKINWFKIRKIHILNVLEKILLYIDYHRKINCNPAYNLFLIYLKQGPTCFDCEHFYESCTCNNFFYEYDDNQLTKIISDFIIYNLPKFGNYSNDIKHVIGEYFDEN